MPEDGSTSKIKGFFEESKMDFNYVMKLDDKRVVTIETLEKRLLVIK